MPWNDNANPGGNPGPWGSPPPSGDKGKGPSEPPKREPPRRPGPTPPGGPDFESLVRNLVEKVRGLITGPRAKGGAGRLIVLAVSGLTVIWLGTGLYIVQPNEQGVVTRFGGYNRSTGPGLHFRLPSPIERVDLVSVTNQNKVLVGGTANAAAPDESLMLTGDENIIDLSFAVQWHISDAAKYLFRVREPDEAVKAVAESAMREVVGRTALKSILTNGRGEVQAQTQALMQQVLDRYQSGVKVDAVQIQNANPPAEVVPAYQDIARAGQDAQSAINDANSYRNRVVNEAKGESAKITQEAEGYRVQVVREAQGQAAQFDQLEAEYRRAPAVTRQRLYIETMQAILQRNHKVIIDAKGANTPVILPPDAFKTPSNEVTVTAPPPAAQAAPAQPQAGAAQPAQKPSQGPR